jgi:hypothetical protein
MTLGNSANLRQDVEALLPGIETGSDEDLFATAGRYLMREHSGFGPPSIAKLVRVAKDFLDSDELRNVVCSAEVRATLNDAINIENVTLIAGVIITLLHSDPSAHAAAISIAVVILRTGLKAFCANGQMEKK